MLSDPPNDRTADRLPAWGPNAWLLSLVFVRGVLDLSLLERNLSYGHDTTHVRAHTHTHTYARSHTHTLTHARWFELGHIHRRGRGEEIKKFTRARKDPRAIQEIKKFTRAWKDPRAIQEIKKFTCSLEFFVTTRKCFVAVVVHVLGEQINELQARVVGTFGFSLQVSNVSEEFVLVYFYIFVYILV